jgi:probable HAF family extracellular repeat protein
MPFSRVPLALTAGALTFLSIGWLWSCTPEVPTSPDAVGPQSAKSATADPTVTSTNPTSGTLGTTLDVQVVGTGYDRGSRAVWALNGDTALTTTKIKTNSTRYVNSKELIANITIADNASLDRYDVVAVTSSGKKGIGIELFTVTPQLIDLGTLPNAWPSFAYQANGSGTVVGYGYTGSNYSGWQHALRWHATVGSVTLEDLTPFLGNTVQSSAYGLNENGDITGYFWTADEKPHAFLLTALGMNDLHPLCGGVSDGKDFSEAYDVNATDEVVGVRGIYTDRTDINYRAFYWSSGCAIELPTLNGHTEARAINDQGVIAGYSGGFPVRWVKDTSAPGGWEIQQLSSTAGRATAINAAGDIVGRLGGGYPPYPADAVLWPAGGGELVLGTLGGTHTEASGIDDAGAVVGWSIKTSGVQRAFRWTAATGMVELSSFSNAKGSGSSAFGAGAGGITGFGDAGSTPRTTTETHAALWIGH